MAKLPTYLTLLGLQSKRTLIPSTYSTLIQHLFKKYINLLPVNFQFPISFSFLFLFGYVHKIFTYYFISICLGRAPFLPSKVKNKITLIHPMLLCAISSIMLMSMMPPSAFTLAAHGTCQTWWRRACHLVGIGPSADAQPRSKSV